MYSQGVMQPQQRPPEMRYVYIKMLTDQADADEGKLRKGDVLVVPEDKAARWVYRAGIARPASKKQFEEFKYEEYKRKGGRPNRRGRAPGYSMPDENEFTYADTESPEWKDAEVNDSNQPVTLSEQLSSVGSEGESDEADENPEDEDSGDEESEDESPPHQEGGSFNQAITRGPGAAPEEDSPIRGRGRRGHL